MTRPVIGVIGNAYELDDRYPVHASGRMYTTALAEISGAMPLIVPTDPALVSVAELLAVCDAFLLTGGQPNVHPSEYGHEETPAHGRFNRARDAVVLPLVREAIARGVPLFGICLGFQELNVALGGTLHPEIRELPGRDNHRMKRDVSLEEQFEHRHMVHFTPGGQFARILGATEVMTNSLHGQGLLDVAERLVIEGHAPDGTPEAAVVRDAPGFALAVQWHPEFNAANDPVSRPLFAAFGEAARAARSQR